MKTQLLVTNVTYVGSPVRPVREIFGMILIVFLPIQAAIVVGEPPCDLGISS